MLQGRLPDGWETSVVKPAKPDTSLPAVDGILRIRRRGTSWGEIVLQARSRVEPTDVDYPAANVRPTQSQPVLIASPFLSPRTQERLRSRGFAYADLTGAARFERGNRVGAWIVSRDVAGVPMSVEVDLMVPDAVGGGSWRVARLPGHATEVAMRREASRPHSSTKP